MAKRSYLPYSELLAAVAANPAEADRLQLLMSVHPDERRWLSEGEELEAHYPALRYLRRDCLDQTAGLDLWFRYFPELRNLEGCSIGDLHKALWHSVLGGCRVLRLAYAFRPLSDQRPAYEELQRLQSTFAEEIAAPNPRQTSLLTFTIPGAGLPAQIIEHKAGLLRLLKLRIGLMDLDPGFLLNYVAARSCSVTELFNPRQFEELVAVLYREEGWDVELTRPSRDGGKDVIARRVERGKPVIAYLEAKRYSRGKPVGIRLIKEFVATVAGDGANGGFLLTTSHFSQPGQNWLADKGIRLAHVELLDQDKLASKVEALAGARPGVFSLPQRPTRNRRSNPRASRTSG